MNKKLTSFLLCFLVLGGSLSLTPIKAEKGVPSSVSEKKETKPKNGGFFSGILSWLMKKKEEKKGKPEDKAIKDSPAEPNDNTKLDLKAGSDSEDEAPAKPEGAEIKEAPAEPVDKEEKKGKPEDKEIKDKLVMPTGSGFGSANPAHGDAKEFGFGYDAGNPMPDQRLKDTDYDLGNLRKVLDRDQPKADENCYYVWVYKHCERRDTPKELPKSYIWYGDKGEFGKNGVTLMLPDVSDYAPDSRCRGNKYSVMKQTLLNPGKYWCVKINRNDTCVCQSEDNRIFNLTKYFEKYNMYHLRMGLGLLDSKDGPGFKDEFTLGAGEPYDPALWGLIAKLKEKQPKAHSGTFYTWHNTKLGSTNRINAWNKWYGDKCEYGKDGVTLLFPTALMYSRAARDYDSLMNIILDENNWKYFESSLSAEQTVIQDEDNELFSIRGYYTYLNSKGKIE